MYYEAGSFVKTHPELEYKDGVRMVFLYVNGELPKDAEPEDRKLRNLLRYIGKIPLRKRLQRSSSTCGFSSRKNIINKMEVEAWLQ